MQSVHDTFAHMGIEFDKIQDSWLNDIASPALEDGLNSTDTNDINNEKPATSLPTQGSAIICMEGSNKTARMASPLEIVSTKTSVNITLSVRIEDNKTYLAHHLWIWVLKMHLRNRTQCPLQEKYIRKQLRDRTQCPLWIVSQEDATARQDSTSNAVTVNENHLAIMTGALTGQQYALHDERQETCSTCE